MSLTLNPRSSAFICGLLLALSAAFAAAPDGHVGSAVCGQCHRDIAAVQSKSRMARTWQSPGTPMLPADYQEQRAEGPITYRALRSGTTKLDFAVKLPGHPALKAPV